MNNSVPRMQSLCVVQCTGYVGLTLKIIRLCSFSVHKVRLCLVSNSSGNLQDKQKKMALSLSSGRRRFYFQIKINAYVVCLARFPSKQSRISKCEQHFSVKICRAGPSPPGPPNCSGSRPLNLHPAGRGVSEPPRLCHNERCQFHCNAYLFLKFSWLVGRPAGPTAELAAEAT